MPNETVSTLTVAVNGGLPAYQYRDLLNVIDVAYNYVYVGVWLLEGYVIGRSQVAKFFPDDQRRYGRLVPKEDRLILSAAEMHSPGFFSFKGSGEVLEQIRLYIQDIHVRRQDRQIREPAEQRKSDLDIQIKETELFRARIAAAKEAGATDDDLRAITSRFFAVPLSGLDVYKDQKLLRSASTETRELEAAHSDAKDEDTEP